MSTTALKFCVEALSMPRKTRAEIAERLLASLEDDEGSGRVEQAWNKVAIKRYKAFKSGRTKGIPHSDVIREAYQSLTAKRK